VFLHLLEKHDIGNQNFEVAIAHFMAIGIAMKQVRIIDVTLIAAPSSTSTSAKS
jgi:transposase, IS5 family